MRLFPKIEEELKLRKPGWWDRVTKLIPELTDLSRTPQLRRYLAEGDVAEHTRVAVEACPSDCDPDLLWSALLQDIGKPLVTKKEGDRSKAGLTYPNMIFT